MRLQAASLGCGGFDGLPGGIVSFGWSFVFMGLVALFRAGDLPRV